MTVKEQIFSAGFSEGVYTKDDFIRQARPAIFGALNDTQKYEFIRLAKREQEIYIEAILKDMKIKFPAAQF
jgi:hypothetical protein